jgi:hypothetical protein
VIVYAGQFFLIKIVAQLLGYFFRQQMLYIDFDKKMYWETFIQTHLVTLTVSRNESAFFLQSHELIFVSPKQYTNLHSYDYYFQDFPYKVLAKKRQFFKKG